MKSPAISIGLGMALALLACAGTLPAIWWSTPLIADDARPLKVAAFIDASYLRRAVNMQSYISIRDSILLGQVVNDEVERGLTAAKMTLSVQRKYFITTYIRHEVNVAQEMGDVLIKHMPPIHLDPTVCRADRTTQAMETLWTQFAALAARGTAALAAQNKPEWATRLIGSTYDADTVALVIAVVRKDDDRSPEAAAPNVASILNEQGGSAVIVGLLRAIDGKVVYFAATTIPGPQRDTYTRDAVTAAFAGLPSSKGHPAYPVPPIQRVD
jgi:hypothetical protein